MAPKTPRTPKTTPSKLNTSVEWRPCPTCRATFYARDRHEAEACDAVSRLPEGEDARPDPVSGLSLDGTGGGGRGPVPLDSLSPRSARPPSAEPSRSET